MHLLFLNASGQMGGAEAALLDIMASLREAEPEWKLELIISAAGPLAAKAEALGVVTTVLPLPDSLSRLGDAGAGGPAGDSLSRFRLLRQLIFRSPDGAAYVRQLRRVLRERAPDLVHSNGFKMHVLAALAKPCAVPLIWHLHDYVQPRPFMALLLKLLQSRCSLVLANSNSVGRDAKLACGNGLPVQTIYNGIDTAVFSPGGERLDLDTLAQLPTARAGTIRVGLLATLARWKGHETFLRALSLLSPELPVRGYVIGDAQYQTEGSQFSLAELKTTAERLGVSGRVGFTGFVAEPAKAMRALDIVVHASTEPEPFGLVIVEAMSCGRAVIVSDAGGAAELIERGVNALSHTPALAEQLAERITQLAADPELRARLGAAGRTTAEQRFNRTRLAQELVPIYHSQTARTSRTFN
jgi:glycosyltransferase involved in cell wall biosynthesis